MNKWSVMGKHEEFALVLISCSQLQGQQACSCPTSCEETSLGFAFPKKYKFPDVFSYAVPHNSCNTNPSSAAKEKLTSPAAALSESSYL